MLVNARAIGIVIEIRRAQEHSMVHQPIEECGVVKVEVPRLVARFVGRGASSSKQGRDMGLHSKGVRRLHSWKHGSMEFAL